jgi:hypothetical protein
MPFHGQVSQEGIDLRRSHFQRMAELVKTDETHDPLGVGFLGAQAVMAHTAGSSQAIQQFWLLSAGICHLWQV